MKELLMNSFAVYILLGTAYYFVRMLLLHLKNVNNFKMNPGKAERTVNLFNSLDIGFSIFVISGAIMDHWLKSKFGVVIPYYYISFITVSTVVLLILCAMTFISSKGNLVSKRYIFTEMGIIMCLTILLSAPAVLFLFLSYKA